MQLNDGKMSTICSDPSITSQNNVSDNRPDHQGRSEPAFQPEQEVPRFAGTGEVPRFADQPEVPLFSPQPEEPPFIPPPPPPAPASRWTSRLALAGVAVVGIAAVAAGLNWFSGQRKVDRSLEVLSMSSRAVEPPLAAPVPAPPPAAQPEPLPPLVTLPPPDAAPKSAVVPAVAKPVKAQPLARTVLKPVAKGKPKAVARKVAAKKPAKAVPRTARVANALRPLPKVALRRRCKSGDLARECLGLPDR